MNALLYEDSNFNFRFVRLSDLDIPDLYATSGDPDQMPHSVMSDLGLHCLPINFCWYFREECVNVIARIILAEMESHSLITQAYYYVASLLSPPEK